ncbi:MAG: hypothetical protein Q7S20_00130 [Gemmatimonadaceae bacterium]|nr:hypothetical protein [Gemmatimonadaceae bacterium]
MRTMLHRTAGRALLNARPWTTALVFLTAACSAANPPVGEPAPEEAPKLAITSSRDLVREMHDRYSDKWYSTLRFEQANTFYTQSGKEEKSRWVENLSVPGKLRIDFEPLSSKSGLLILNNRVMTFDNGRRVDSRRSIQPILTLTADVYAIPPAVTLRRLDSLRMDLDKFRSGRLDRKRVYVIGADEGDEESSQVWIDADKLLLLRIIQREKRGDRTVVTDTRVGEYKEIDGFQVAHEFVSLRDGKPYFREQYEKVRVNEPIPPAVFDPLRWSAARPDA